MNKRAIALLKFELCRLRGNQAAQATGYSLDPKTEATIKDYEDAVAVLAKEKKDERPVRRN